MKQRFAILFLLCAIASATAQAQQHEYIILVGGPSLHQWEQYKAQPHDHWWANFVHSARVRTEQVRAQVGPETMITWLVYKPGYLDRGIQEIQEELKTKRYDLPPVPPYPNRNPATNNQP